MDIAQLGFEIDSKPAADAAQNLDKMTASAVRAETGTARARASIERVVQEIRALAEATRGGASGIDRMVDAQMRTIDAIDRMASQMGALSSASRTAARASEEVAASAGTAGRAINAMGESADEQASRIREMVRQSLAAKEVAGGIEQSQRSLAERASMTAEQVRALNDALDAAANSPEAVQRRVDALNESQERAARAAQAAGSAQRDQGAELERLLGQIDPVVRKLGELDAIEDQLRAAHKAGLIGEDDYAEYASKIDQARDAVSGLGGGVDTLGQRAAVTNRQMSALVRNLAVGNFSGAQTQLTGIGLQLARFAGPITAAAAAVGVLAAAVLAGAADLRRFENALTASGNIAGTTATRLRQMADAIGNETGRYREARDVVETLARGGQIAGAALESASRAAVAISAITGQSIDQATSQIEGLGKEPVRAIIELNDKYHFLTVAVYEQIAALREQGREEEATALAAETAANALEDRARKISENLGYIGTAAREAKGFVNDLWATLKRLGTGDSIMEDIAGGKINALYAQMNTLRELQAGITDGRTGRDLSDDARGRIAARYEAEIAAIDAKIAALKDEANATSSAENAEAIKQRTVEAGFAASERMRDTLTANADKQTQLAAAIEKTRQEFDKMRAANVTMVGEMSIDDAEAARIAQITAQYKTAAPAIRETADAGADLVAKLQEQAATFGLSGTELERYRVSITAMSAEQRKAALDTLDLIDAQAEIARAQAEESAALQALQGMAASYAGNVDYMRAKLAGASDAQIKFSRAMRDAQKAFQAAGGASNADAVKAYAEAVAMAREELDIGAQVDEWDRFSALIQEFGGDHGLGSLVDVASSLRTEIERLSDPMSDAFDPSRVAKLQGALDGVNKSMRERNMALMQQGVSSLQKYAKEGTAAYTALGIAQDVLAYKSAVAAIANQGGGDTYTAFARIAAMIALMASIGIRVGGGGGGGPSSQSAEVRQATQGTGSVLGDAAAKSESIAHAIEITANATQQLVGINRGMLTALHALQNALGAAGGMLARGAGNVEFTRSIGDAGNWNWLFGGDSKLIDEGIIIAGGRLNDMLNSIVVGAYQTVETSGGWFHSDRTSDEVVDVSDEFGRQFQLVIGSIIDTVRQGALALGLLPADIEAAIAQYQVAEMRISLKGLSGEDAQKELEAVFSSLFDGLAGAVVPFIEQFQQVGEGLGETLIRIATEVQVAQQAFAQLGLAVDETDPEKFAQIADGLIQAAGGLDEFITQMNSFVQHFAPEAHQFAIAQDALNSAFAQSGLVLPATREELWALMQTLDATTESGREQIATLLRLADTADQYYSMIERLTNDMVKQLEAAYDTLSDFGVGVGEGGNKLRAISQSAIDAIAAANLLAKAAGQQGAAEWQLALIHRVAAARAAEAIAQLMQATRELVAQFYGTDVAATAETASAAVSGFGDAMSAAAQKATDAIRLLLGDLSPLNDQAKLQVALDALGRGEVGREDVLEIGRRLYASSDAYNTLFNRVMAMRVPGTGGIDAGIGGGTIAAAEAAQVTPEQRARERMDLAMQIGQNVATLANAQGEDFDTIADMLGLNLTDIAKALGLSNDELTEYLQNLVDQENRTPDSIAEGADRIIAALYDIAGMTAQDKPVAVTARPPDTLDPWPDADEEEHHPARGRAPREAPRFPQRAAQDADSRVEDSRNLAATRELLERLVGVTQGGTIEITGAVREVAAATREVSGTLREGDEDAALGARRNGRVATR